MAASPDALCFYKSLISASSIDPAFLTAMQSLSWQGLSETDVHPKRGGGGDVEPHLPQQNIVQPYHA